MHGERTAEMRNVPISVNGPRDASADGFQGQDGDRAA